VLFRSQYAHARICSILKFAGKQGIELKKTSEVDSKLLNTEEELDLIRKIAEFEEVIQRCAETRAPHMLPKYAQELAGVFHVFYTQCRVVGEEEALSAARMVLIDCTRIVLHNALAICGVTAPESM
jgi:arginyl-tRNA synthetase